MEFHRWNTQKNWTGIKPGYKQHIDLCRCLFLLSEMQLQQVAENTHNLSLLAPNVRCKSYFWRNIQTYFKALSTDMGIKQTNHSNIMGEDWEKHLFFMTISASRARLEHGHDIVLFCVIATCKMASAWTTRNLPLCCFSLENASFQWLLIEVTESPAHCTWSITGGGLFPSVRLRPVG